MTEMLTGPLVAEHCIICERVMGERERDSADHVRSCPSCADLPPTWNPNERRRIRVGERPIAATLEQPIYNDDDDDDDDEEPPYDWACPSCGCNEAVLEQQRTVTSCFDCTQGAGELRFHANDVNLVSIVSCASCGRTVTDDWGES